MMNYLGIHSVPYAYTLPCGPWYVFAVPASGSVAHLRFVPVLVDGWSKLPPRSLVDLKNLKSASEATLEYTVLMVGNGMP